MRLTRAARGLLVALVASCTSPKSDVTAPVIVEPGAGVVVDRCLVRVRTNHPDPGYSRGTPVGGGTESGIHVNWRTNHGANSQVGRPTLDNQDSPFLFGATLASGLNHLEVGHCSAFDDCQWASRDLTVALRPGSPDPAFAGSGQVVIADYPRAYSATQLSDGRVLLQVDDPALGPALISVRPDGTREREYGDHGAALLPERPRPGRIVVPQADGAALVLLPSMIVRLRKDGTRDPSFGAVGVVAFRAPAGAIEATEIAADRTGGFTVAGVTHVDPQVETKVESFLIKLGADGAQLSYLALDATGAFRPSAVDADGHVVSLGPGSVRLDTPTGPDLSFGSGGILTLPASSTPTLALAFHDGGLATARLVPVAGQNAVRVTLISRGGVVGREVDIPIDASPPSMASAPDGSLYVAGMVAHPMEPASQARDNLPGTDFAVARIRGGALDTSFGDAGIAHASFMVARTPIVLETINDRPFGLTLGTDGAPWLFGTSGGIVTDGRAWLNRVDPFVAIARFLP